MLLYWAEIEKGNWGDDLNPVIFEALSGKKSKKITLFRNSLNEPEYIPNDKTFFMCIGSMLKFANYNTIVWGTGFKAMNQRVFRPPKKVCAVRGPLTRKLLLEQGINCPQIYGDPAILYPMFYSPNIKPKYPLGIIPHFIDQNSLWLTNVKKRDDILIIDIRAGIKEVVRAICSCEKIASSSLHGIIAADAYKIPSIFLIFSDKVKGFGFKFMDYFLSVGRKDYEPLYINIDTSLQDLYNKFSHYEIKINLNALLEACPFKKKIKLDSGAGL